MLSLKIDLTCQRPCAQVPGAICQRPHRYGASRHPGPRSYVHGNRRHGGYCFRFTRARARRSSPSLAARIPAAAWAWLDTINLSAEFARPVRCFQAPPKFMVAAALRIIGGDRPSAQQLCRAWVLFLLIPRFLFHHTAARHASSRAALLRRVDEFHAGRWEALVTAAHQAACPGPAPEAATPAQQADRSRRRACAQVHAGDLSRARSTLTSAALAPGAPATLAALTDPADRIVMAASRLLGAAAACVILLSFAAEQRKSYWNGCVQAAIVICQQIFSTLALAIFLLKILLKNASKSSFFCFGVEIHPVLKLQFSTQLRVVLLSFATQSLQIAL